MAVKYITAITESITSIYTGSNYTWQSAYSCLVMLLPQSCNAITVIL